MSAGRIRYLGLARATSGSPLPAQESGDTVRTVPPNAGDASPTSEPDGGGAMAPTSSMRRSDPESAVAPARRDVLRGAWSDEMATARAARARGDLATAWHHLERAHILSQPMAGPHVRTHLAMLGHGLRRRDRREVLGQIARLVVAAPGTWTERYPVGNTGGADVSALRPMPIPEDLRAILEDGVTARTDG